MAERSPDVTCAIKAAMKGLLGHRKMSKEELHKTTTTGEHMVRAAGTSYRARLLHDVFATAPLLLS